MSKEIPGQCHHESCRCSVGANEKYCSEQCKSLDASAASHAAGADCNCGHPACQSDG